MILGEDNQKMSKSRGNVISPDQIIEDYGADSLRLYEMFMGPLEATKPWSMAGVEGVYRFLARVWRLAMTENQEGVWEISLNLVEVEPNPPQNKVIHATIKKVTEDIESLAFNTAISQMMIYVNTFTNVEQKPVIALRTLLILLNPFAPHLTEELWQRLSQRFSIFSGQISQQSWPNWDEAYLMEEEVEVVVQVNGKLRDRITVRKDLENQALEKLALAAPKVKDSTAGKTVQKIVIVPNRVVNIVVAGDAR
jgi:leucyl-tRNA synthetase